MFKIFVTVSKDNIDSILYAKRIEVASKPTEINGAAPLTYFLKSGNPG